MGTYLEVGATLRIGNDLPNDYGAPRIRPSLPGSNFFLPRDNFGWYLFAGAGGRAVAYNIFLDGNTDGNSSVSYTHLKGIHRERGELVASPKGLKQRRLHKAFLRYHDAENWPLLREALKRMGRTELIGNGKRHLIPSWQPAGTGTVGGAVSYTHLDVYKRQVYVRP